jgi:hypothetical protein
MTNNDIPVYERVQRLKNLLLKWKDNGVPPGVTLPKSLTKARDWAVPEYEIFPIGSKRDLNTKHKDWGDDVALIDDILKALRSGPLTRQPYQPERLRRLRAQAKLSVAEEQLANVTAEWHAEREKAQIAENRRSQSEKKLELVQAEKKLLIAENAELLRSMAFENKKLQLVR